MKAILKGLLRVAFLVLIGFVTVTATILSVEKSHEIPSQNEIAAISNISQTITLNARRAISRSRASTVRVISVSSELGGISTSSGTYITFQDKFYILTVAHGLIGDCEGTGFATDKGVYHCKELVAMNSLIDYGIMEVDEIAELDPVEIPEDIPRGAQWKRDFSIMQPIYYTGFPNGMGPFTLNGNVIGYNENDFVYIKSYGWSGCSGAGLFGESGRLVGYVLALTVGQTQYGYNVAEDILIAVPLFKVNWLSIIKPAKQEKKDEKEFYESKLSDSASSDSGNRYSD